MSKPNPNQSAIAFAGAFQDLVRETIRAEFFTLREEGGGLREEVRNLREDVRGLRSEFSTLREEVGGLSNKVDFMGGELKKLKDFTADGFREVNEKIADLMTPA